MDPLAHASVGLMAKAVAPRAPLWALLAATQVPDALCFGLMAAGIEQAGTTQMDFRTGLKYLAPAHFPWSHGLLMSAVWSIAAAAIALRFRRGRRASITIGLMVFSHWALDFAVYANLPVLPDGTRLVGLGLLRSGAGVIAGIVLEIGLIAGGIATYLVTRRRPAALAPE
ncbi:MAG: metal-dependent hydrolase [Anaerolineae bacterium]